MQQPVKTCPGVKNESAAFINLNDVLQHLTNLLIKLKESSKPELENIVSANNPVLQYFNSTNQTNNQEGVAAILHNLLLINRLVLQKNVKGTQPQAAFSETIVALSKLTYTLFEAAENYAQLREGRESTTAGTFLTLSLQIAKIVELAITKTATPVTKSSLQRNLNNMVLIQSNAQWNLGIAFAKKAAENNNQTDATRIESYKFALQHLESGLRTTLLKNNNDLTKVDAKWVTYLLQVCNDACVFTKNKTHCTADNHFFLQEKQRLTKEFGNTESVKKMKTEPSNDLVVPNAVIPKQAYFQAAQLSETAKIPLIERYEPKKLPPKKRSHSASFT